MKRLLLAAAIVLVVIAAGLLALPPPHLLRYQDTSLAFFDRQGRLMRLTLAADQRYRLQVPLADIAPILREATLLYEDQEYYRHFSKDEIFEAYLNLAPYGRNIEGIEAASLIYFNKRAAELTLPEALTLCVIPQNPIKRNPTTTQGFTSLKTARDPLFTRWLKSHPEAAGLHYFFDMPMQVRPPK